MIGQLYLREGHGIGGSLRRDSLRQNKATMEINQQHRQSLIRIALPEPNDPIV
jgi:hypothetical protein